MRHYSAARSEGFRVILDPHKWLRYKATDQVALASASLPWRLHVRKVLFMFADLSDSDVDWFAVTGQKRVFSKGSILIEQGKPVEDVFILLDGELSVHVRAGDKQVVVNTLQTGELIGELSFLDSRPPSATVIAETEAVV